jgi:hypothetical protein
VLNFKSAHLLRLVLSVCSTTSTCLSSFPSSQICWTRQCTRCPCGCGPCNQSRRAAGMRPLSWGLAFLSSAGHCFCHLLVSANSNGSQHSHECFQVFNLKQKQMMNMFLLAFHLQHVFVHNCFASSKTQQTCVSRAVNRRERNPVISNAMVPVADLLNHKMHERGGGRSSQDGSKFTVCRFPHLPSCTMYGKMVYAQQFSWCTMYGKMVYAQQFSWCTMYGKMVYAQQFSWCTMYGKMVYAQQFSCVTFPVESSRVSLFLLS